MDGDEWRGLVEFRESFVGLDSIGGRFDFVDGGVIFAFPKE